MSGFATTIFSKATQNEPDSWNSETLWYTKSWYTKNYTGVCLGDAVGWSGRGEAGRERRGSGAVSGGVGPERRAGSNWDSQGRRPSGGERRLAHIFVPEDCIFNKWLLN